MSEKVLFVGQGYVGLPVAMRAVECGFLVVGLDSDERRVEMLERGVSPVEDVPDDRLRNALESGRYEPTVDPGRGKDFDFAVISVPTPLRDGVPDLSHITDASRTVGAMVTAGSCVILESTTWPGTTEEVVGPILEERSGMVAGRDFHLGYSPERIDPGNRDWPFERIPKVVSGIDEASLRAVCEFYSRLVERIVPVSGCKEAELTKLLENTFRHVNVALMNELAMFAHDLGIDIWEAIEAAATKPFGFMRFEPGPGVGGHCLPVDPSYLSWRVRTSLGETFRFVELANDVNEHMPSYVVGRIVRSMNERSLPVKGRRVLLLGVAYKKNTGDARESPARGVARHLLELGAEVVAADPHVDPLEFPDGVVPVDATPEEVSRADVVVLLVDHDTFDLDQIVASAKFVFDTRHRVSGENVEHL